MADTKELIAKRIEAYEHIKNTLHRPPWNIPLDTPDAKLADILGGTIELADSLRLLGEGKHNPTTRLITAFKDFVGGFVSNSDIDAHLIDPFN